MTINEIIMSTEEIEPETIRQMFPTLNELDIEKVHAARLIIHTRFPFEDFYVFEDTVLALNGSTPDFSILQGCTPEQIWYAVDIMTKLRPQVEFSWEVQAYCKWMSNDAGVYIYPPVFDDLDNPYYEKAVELAKGELIDNSSIESTQAGKYLVIQVYINRTKKEQNTEWR